MKKFNLFVLTAMMLVVLTAVSAAAALLGDADNDGRVRASDARKILRHAAKVEIETDEFLLKLMDTDQSGSIKAADARLALRMASRQETTVEYSEPASGEDPTVPTLPGDDTTAEQTAAPTTTPPVPTAPTVITTAEPSPTETTATAPEETTIPPTEETTVPQTEETTVPPTEETTAPAPEETTAPAPEETTAPAPEETTAPAPEETTAPAEPVDPVAGVVFHDNFYIDADIYTYEGGRENLQSVKIALSKEEKKSGNKTLTLCTQYIRTDSFMPGHDVGVMIRDEMNLLGTGTEKKLYMINYDDNEYLVMGSSLFEMMGVDIDEMMAENPVEDMALPTFSDLSGLNVSEGEYDGKTYQVITIPKEGGESKYFVEQRSDGQYYPVIAESYAADGALVTRMVIREFSTDASAYTSVPTGMKAYKINALNIISALPFFEKLGV